MKKKLSILLFLVFFTAASSFAQQQNQDVVYLKNGSIIRGVIIGQEEKSIKIMTTNGTVLTFSMQDISVINTAALQEETINKTTAIRKGYLGLSFGTSLPLGDSSSSLRAGADFRINFGYLFSERWGLAAVIGGQSYRDKSYNNDDYVVTNTLLVGPQFTTPLSSNLEWDIRPMIGFGAAYDDNIQYYNYVGSSSHSSSQSNTVFAGGLGTSLRLHTSSKFSFLFNADYNFIVDVDYSIKKETLSNMTFGIGFAYRLK